MAVSRTIVRSSVAINLYQTSSSALWPEHCAFAVGAVSMAPAVRWFINSSVQLTPSGAAKAKAPAGSLLAGMLGGSVIDIENSPV